MNKVLDIISKISCLVLCIVLFFAMFFYLTLYSVTKVVNRDNITTVVASLDIKTLIDEEELNSIYDENLLNENDRKIVEGILNSNDFKTVIGKYFGNVFELVLYNKENDKITKDEVMYIFENNIDYVSSQYGIYFTHDEKNEILKSLENECLQIVNMLSNEQEIINELSSDELETIRFLFGKSLQNILLVVIGILVTLIAIFRWSVYRFAIWTGVTTIISGAFFAAVGVSLNSLLQAQFSVQLTSTVLEILDKNVFGFITNLGLIVLVIGIVQILYYFILKKSNESVKV